MIHYPRLTVALEAGRRLLHQVATRLRVQRRPVVRVTLVVADSRACRSIVQLLSRSVRCIEEALGAPFPADAILVQWALSDGQPASSLTTQTGRVVVRLGLYADGRRLTDDEVLAALADQALTLSAPAPAGAPRATPSATTRAMPPDPLAPVAITPAHVRPAA